MRATRAVILAPPEQGGGPWPLPSVRRELAPVTNRPLIELELETLHGVGIREVGVVSDAELAVAAREAAARIGLDLFHIAPPPKDGLAARLLAAALAACGVPTEYVDAVRVVHTDGRHGNAGPDVARTRAAAAAVLGPVLARGAVPVVPGFIGCGGDGSVVTLGRGGSDLTATLLAGALGAREVCLWKDVPGMLTADPRVVPDARLIPVLHVREAADAWPEGNVRQRTWVSPAEAARMVEDEGLRELVQAACGEPGA
jgi:hypothetical protein